VRLAETAKLFAAYGLWRATGWAVAGRTLIATLGSSDANNRMIAGMFLVKGGRLALPLVADALESGRGLPLILNVAGDLGHTELAPLVERYTGAPDERIAQQAAVSLKLLRRAGTAAGEQSGPSS
jgi:hypothetical protein